MRELPKKTDVVTAAPRYTDVQRRVIERVQRMTPEEGFQSLVDAGIFTPDGKLTPDYQRLKDGEDV